jgi:hypothetical protein
MARQTHVAQDAPGSYPTVGVALTFTAADVANKEELTMTGQELLLALNTGVGAQLVTIETVANQRGRTADITADSLAAGAMHCYGPFTNKSGWEQAGKLLFEADAVDVEFAVVKIA